MNQDDIKELLEHAGAEIDEICRQCATGRVNRVALKNVLENLRSTLDYAAQDMSRILNKHIKPEDRQEKVYFPYGRRENHFKISVKKNFLLLDTKLPEIYKRIRSEQPFESNDPWLVDLCELTNEAKHNNLSGTENKKTVNIRQGGAIHIQGAGSVVLHNNYCNGRRLDDVYVDGDGNVSISKHSGSTEITENNRISFKGKQLEIGPFLTKCHAKLNLLLSDIYKHL